MRFLAYGVLEPGIETDAGGHAKVTFQAPDNLTAFRLMAVAADATERFGSGDRRLPVSKPLQLLTAMPRFLNVGDDAKGGVLVVNDTGQAGSVTVDATVSGARLRSGAHQEIAICGERAVPALPPLRAERLGELKLRVKAVLGAENDGLELKHPDSLPGARRDRAGRRGPHHQRGRDPGEAARGHHARVGVAGGVDGSRRRCRPGGGAARSPSSTRTAASNRPPHASYPLAVAVEELAKSLKLTGLDGPALQKFIRAGLGKLEKFQTDEGGFSLWIGGKAEPYLTAFALWGLKLASDAGHKLPPGLIDRGTRYLRAQLGRVWNVAEGVHSELGELGSRAFAVHVLGILTAGPRATRPSCSRRRRRCRASARRSWRARWRRPSARSIQR